MAKFYYHKYEIAYATKTLSVSSKLQYSPMADYMKFTSYTPEDSYQWRKARIDPNDTGDYFLVYYYHGYQLLLLDVYEAYNPNIVGVIRFDSFKKENYLYFMNGPIFEITGVTSGEFIETIKAEEGTYPDNGISGDYWYVKGDKAFPNVRYKDSSGTIHTIGDGSVNGRSISAIKYKDSNGVVKECK